MKNFISIKTSLWAGLAVLSGLFIIHLLQADAPETMKKPPKEERIAGRFMQEFLMTRDLRLDEVPVERMLVAFQVAQEKRLLKDAGDLPIFWEERGPNNVGGRTRGVLIDANDPSGQTVWAGGVAGGLWLTTNIDAAAPLWTPINDLFENLALSTIAQDAANPQTMYFGTGECWGNQDAVRGLGAWISTDGGANWQMMPSLNGDGTSPCIAKMMVDANGTLFAATTQGLRRFNPMTGAWPTVFAGFVTDLEIAANGDMYAARFAAGVWRSTDGGTMWNPANTGLPTANFGRVELACAPGNANVVYAILADTTTANSGNCLAVFRTNNAGGMWNAATCPGGFGNQAWYDLILAVDPTDANRVWAGGVPLCLSTDGGMNWNNFGGGALHVDHHAILFQPGDPTQILFGNDGGMYKTYNGGDASPTFVDKNNTYNVTQFYAVALHPDAYSDYMLGGTQDNATPVFTGPGINSTNCVLCCCDGGWAFIDADDPMIQIASTQNGSFSLSTDGGTTFANIVPGNNARPFITPAEYDDAQNILYYSDTPGRFGRVSDVGGTNTNTSDTIPAFGGVWVTAFAVSPATANRVYMGTQNGQIFRVDNADQAGMATVTNLNTTGPGGWVSSIAVDPSDENHILYSMSNYGINSIWETPDGGVTWQSIEGDLPDMPVRWIMFWPGESDKAMVATELGIWYAKDLAGPNTVWNPTNEAGLANCRVDMLRSRPSDKLVVAATHGRGMYSSDYFRLLDSCQASVVLPGNVGSGLYMASEFISSDGTVPAGNTVFFQAGVHVELLSDFTVERGANFWALLKPCSPGVMPFDDDPEDQAAVIQIPEAATFKAPDPDLSLRVRPNPTRTQGEVQFVLAEAGRVRLYLLNARGELAAILAEGRLEAGDYSHTLETSSLPGGVYMLVLKTNRATHTERLVVVK